MKDTLRYRSARTQISREAAGVPLHRSDDNAWERTGGVAEGHRSHGTGSDGQTATEPEVWLPRRNDQPPGGGQQPSEDHGGEHTKPRNDDRLAETRVQDFLVHHGQGWTPCDEEHQPEVVSQELRHCHRASPLCVSHAEPRAVRRPSLSRVGAAHARVHYLIKSAPLRPCQFW